MINEIEVDGKKYVDKEELGSLIKEHKAKTKEGTEPGFIEENEEKRLAGYLALNHLQSVIFSDEAMDRAKKRVDKMKKQRVIVAFTTKEDGSRQADYFTAWIKMNPELPEKVQKQLIDIGLTEDKSAPMFSSEWEEAMVFDDPEFAKIQAERVRAFFDENDEVISVPYLHIAIKSGRRLLDAMFRNEKDAEESGVEYSPSEEDE